MRVGRGRFLGTSVDDCRAWWETGRRRWHHSVDVPEDIKKAEALLAVESVVGLDRALSEVEGSGVSEFTKGTVGKVFRAHIEYWLSGLDMGVLGV